MDQQSSKGNLKKWGGRNAKLKVTTIKTEKFSTR